MIRPLLDVGRDDIETFLRHRALPFRVDASNDDRAIPRNRIRHEVLPLLGRRCSPRVVEALARAARLVSEDEAVLEHLTTAEVGRLVKTFEGRVHVDLEGLARLPRAVQRRLVWYVLRHTAGGRAVTADHVARVLAVAAEPGGIGRRVALPGAWAQREDGVLVVRARRAELSADTPAQHLQSDSSTSCRLPIPGAVEDRRGDWLVSVSSGRCEPGASRVQVSPWQGAVDAGVAGGELFVRTRRPGDRFRPLGLGGHKKLQDYFVDRKVARRDRDRIPLVVDAQDRIVWVAGHVIAEEFRVTPATTGVLLFELSPCRRLV